MINNGLKFLVNPELTGVKFPQVNEIEDHIFYSQPILKTERVFSTFSKGWDDLMH